MTTTQEINRIEETEEAVNIQELLMLCLGKWHWFVISVFATVSIAIFYLLSTAPVYTRDASLLIKENAKGQSLGNEVGSAFADMGIFKSSTNVYNELISLQSPALMLDVIKRLHLDVNYATDGTFYRRTLYGRELPLSVQFENLADNENVSMTVTPLADGKFLLSEFVKEGEEVGKDSTFQVGFNESLVTPIGSLSLVPTAYTDALLEGPVYVSRVNYYETITNYSAKLNVSLADKQSSVIKLSFQDVSIQRAEELLNTLIAVYNESWVKDKNQIAISTSMFINDRLQVIERELGHVDSDISSFKSEHLLPDVQAASNLYMTQSTQTTAQIMEINNQLSMARYIRNYLVNISSSKDQLLPANSGLESSSVESQIAEYNKKQLQRNSLVANSSENNPLVIDLDHALQAMRAAIISSIDNLVASLNTQLMALEQSEKRTTSRIADNPNQAKYLLSVERQQKVKEALYLYLLQKREENELSQAFTAYNSRVITPPSGNLKPTSPVKRNVLLIAFMLGLLIPVAIIFLRENMNTKIRGKKDLEAMTIPFVGEIPQAFPKKKRPFSRKPEKKVFTVVVKSGSRNVINEAFRVVRTNIEFMIGKDSSSKVIMLTSANPDSGKTFINYNLALSLGIKGKRVIVVDLDLRKASLSESVASPKVGISDYLAGQVDQIEKIICKPADGSPVEVIPVGTLPPNPAELLYSERLESLISDLRDSYDYIFIDCPPVEIVADSAIINNLVDQTVFVVRAGLLERAMLPEIERYYKEKKYKNMSLLLNGTDSGTGRYGYKYGYKYGYHYGYSGYTHDKE